MKIAIALLFAFGFSGIAKAQCENGVCLLQKVAAVVSVPVRLVAEVAQPVRADNCGCNGQCGQPGCTCAPSVAAVQTFAAVPLRTPLRTGVRAVLRAPFRARPLQRLFGCGM